MTKEKSKEKPAEKNIRQTFLNELKAAWGNDKSVQDVADQYALARVEVINGLEKAMNEAVEAYVKEHPITPTELALAVDNVIASMVVRMSGSTSTLAALAQAMGGGQQQAQGPVTLPAVPKDLAGYG